jgi:hypothetical protein
MLPGIEYVIDHLAQSNEHLTNQQVFNECSEQNDTETLKLMMQGNLWQVVVDKERIARYHASRLEHAQMWLSGNPGGLSRTRAEMALNDTGLPFDPRRPVVTDGTHFSQVVAIKYSQEIDRRRQVYREQQERREAEARRKREQEQERIEEAAQKKQVWKHNGKNTTAPKRGMSGIGNYAINITKL